MYVGFVGLRGLCRVRLSRVVKRQYFVLAPKLENGTAVFGDASNQFI
jgi:hypothetical protein